MKLSDIKCKGNNYWLIFPRINTGIISKIPLLDIPIDIIKKYHPDFLKIKDKDIPIFKNMSNQKTNEYLKEIAEVCGITKHLTFHIARKSFATMAFDNGVSLESISKILGHSSTRSTERYITISSKKIEEEMALMNKRTTLPKDDKGVIHL